MRAKTTWTAVRVSAETKGQLEELREVWMQLAHKTKESLGDDHIRSGQESKNDVIGLDQVIRKLIRFHMAHRERVKKSAAKKRHTK